MARNPRTDQALARPLRRVMIGLLLLLCLALFAIWRIDSPRAERLRAQVVDTVVPGFDWVLAPLTALSRFFANLEDYRSLYQENQELRREIQKLRGWRETALQLEQEYARLLELNNVHLNERLTFVTALVIADSGSPFRQAVLLNVGEHDGIMDGWAAVDALGLVGRISGVGPTTARVLLLTDPSSRVPVTLEPSGQKAILSGDNSRFPVLELIERADGVRAGDRVVTSGDAGVLPSGLNVGRVVRATDGRLRVQLAADYARLEFVRVLRGRPIEEPDGVGGMVLPAPGAPVNADPGAQGAGGGAGAADGGAGQGGADSSTAGGAGDG